MDATYRNEKLEQAIREQEAARVRYATAKTVKARRAAAEDVEFWGSRKAFLIHARGVGAR